MPKRKFAQGQGHQKTVILEADLHEAVDRRTIDEDSSASEMLGSDGPAADAGEVISPTKGGCDENEIRS
jgi:hypothetical protein